MKDVTPPRIHHMHRAGIVSDQHAVIKRVQDRGKLLIELGLNRFTELSGIRRFRLGTFGRHGLRIGEFSLVNIDTYGLCETFLNHLLPRVIPRSVERRLILPDPPRELNPQTPLTAGSQAPKTGVRRSGSSRISRSNNDRNVV